MKLAYFNPIKIQNVPYNGIKSSPYYEIKVVFEFFYMYILMSVESYSWWNNLTHILLYQRKTVPASFLHCKVCICLVVFRERGLCAGHHLFRHTLRTGRAVFIQERWRAHTHHTLPRRLLTTLHIIIERGEVRTFYFFLPP